MVSGDLLASTQSIQTISPIEIIKLMSKENRKNIMFMQYRKKEKSTLNFRIWLLTLLAIGNFILGPLIIYMGYNAS